MINCPTLAFLPSWTSKPRLSEIFLPVLTIIDGIRILGFFLADNRVDHVSNGLLSLLRSFVGSANDPSAKKIFDKDPLINPIPLRFVRSFVREDNLRMESGRKVGRGKRERERERAVFQRQIKKEKKKDGLVGGYDGPATREQKNDDLVPHGSFTSGDARSSSCSLSCLVFRLFPSLSSRASAASQTRCCPQRYADDDD